jgi:hypothetical protein
MCYSAPPKERSLNYALRAFVYVLYMHTLISFAVRVCLLVGWCMVHGSLFSSCCVCVHVHFAEGEERERKQISAHFLSHADDSCIGSASYAAFPTAHWGTFPALFWQKAKQCNTLHWYKCCGENTLFSPTLDVFTLFIFSR